MLQCPFVVLLIGFTATALPLDDNFEIANGGEIVVEEVLEERSIQSINYPLNYLDNIDEEDKLEVNEGFVVELTFEFFQLEKDNSTSGQCRFDYVEILESNGKGVKLCGDDVRSGQKFHSEGKEMTVRFHSDESITEKGFKATWKEVPK